jgi:hypothetical protein
MQLLPAEKILFASKNNALELTNLRVRKTVRTGSYTEMSSIYLDRLSSTRLRSWDPKGLLYVGIVIAALGLLVGFMQHEHGATAGGVVVGLFLVGLYFVFRRQFFEFTGFGGEKIIYATKSGFDACAGLLQQIEAAQAVANGKIAEMPPTGTQAA